MDTAGLFESELEESDGKGTLDVLETLDNMSLESEKEESEDKGLKSSSLESKSEINSGGLLLLSLSPEDSSENSRDGLEGSRSLLVHSEMIKLENSSGTLLEVIICVRFTTLHLPEITNLLQRDQGVNLKGKSLKQHQRSNEIGFKASPDWKTLGGGRESKEEISMLDIEAPPVKVIEWSMHRKFIWGLWSTKGQITVKPP
ncbi:hypothetical protein F5146DRAFT_1007338 [Armillaria mellea]|nr:hypothetical protein F5146DRAFT_1007338 [Armillaria mellea]